MGQLNKLQCVTQWNTVRSLKGISKSIIIGVRGAPRYSKWKKIEQ